MKAIIKEVSEVDAGGLIEVKFDVVDKNGTSLYPFYLSWAFRTVFKMK
jgi:hypothetical protein